MKTIKIMVGLLALIAMLSGAPIFAESYDNMGKDFVIGFLPNIDSDVECELHLTAEIATDVTIEYPYNAPTFSTTVAVSPGNITVVSLPTAVAESWIFGSAYNNSVHAFAGKEFICYMVNRRAYSSDAALALPTDVMGFEFIVATYRGSDLHSSDGGEFVVVAAHPGTEVTIIPTRDLVGGYAAGDTFTVSLNQGEGFLARTVEINGTGADLAGTIVTSSNPIGLTNGNKCTNIPPGIYACDHVFEVAQAVQTWGTRIFCVNLPNRSGGSIYRILGSADSTVVKMDGAPLVILNRGEVYETDIIPGNHIIEGSNRIFVIQFMTGQDNPGASSGDPAMGNLSPSEQYLSSYTFSTIGGGQFMENFLTIVAHNDDVGLLTLDAVPVDASNYTAIGASDFSAAVIPLTEGVHTTFSPDSTHGITIEGYNQYDSYIYPGGAMFIPIPPCDTCVDVGGDTTRPVCELTYDNCMAFGTATDVGDSITGIFGVHLNPGSVGLVLEIDSGFIPGDIEVHFTVSLVDPFQPGSGIITVTDNVGLSCQSVIEIDCGSEPQDSIIPTPEWVNIYCGDPMLEGVPLNSGDNITAYDPDGVLCGMGQVRADGSFGMIPIYADDIYTADVDEGADPGDPISLMINGVPVTSDPSLTWTTNGAIFELCLFRVEQCLQFNLDVGWNLISWNVAYNDDIEAMIADYSGSIDIIQSFDQGGLTFDPNLVEFSTLTSVDHHYGYWFKMSAPVSFELCGQIISDNDYINIYSGWNLVSYWPEDMSALETGFGELMGDLQVALGYDNGGLVWVDGQNVFNTLTDLYPQFGYWIKVGSDHSLTYNGGLGAPINSGNGQTAKVLSAVAPTQKWMSVYGSKITLDGHEIANSVIDIYTKDDVLVGSGSYTNGMLKFTAVYGQDGIDQTSANYPQAGDKLFVDVNGDRTETEITFGDHGSRVRLTNLSLGKGETSGLTPTSFSLAQNYPNPFNPVTEISYSLPKAGHVTLEVYNTLGQRVVSLIDDQKEAGIHTVKWDASSHASGIYLYKIQTGEYIETKKMMLLR